MSASEEASDQEEIVLYRCTDCGKQSVSVGWLHAHIEKHFAWLGLFIPPWKLGDFDRLMEKTEILRVTEYEYLESIQEVEHIE